MARTTHPRSRHRHDRATLREQRDRWAKKRLARAKNELVRPWQQNIDLGWRRYRPDLAEEINAYRKLTGQQGPVFSVHPHLLLTDPAAGALRGLDGRIDRGYRRGVSANQLSRHGIFRRCIDEWEWVYPESIDGYRQRQERVWRSDWDDEQLGPRRCRKKRSRRPRGGCDHDWRLRSQYTSTMLSVGGVTYRWLSTTERCSRCRKQTTHRRLQRPEG